MKLKVIDKVLEAPHTTIIDRLDETTALVNQFLNLKIYIKKNFNIVNNLMNDLIIRNNKTLKKFLESFISDNYF